MTPPIPGMDATERRRDQLLKEEKSSRRRQRVVLVALNRLDRGRRRTSTRKGRKRSKTKREACRVSGQLALTHTTDITPSLSPIGRREWADPHFINRSAGGGSEKKPAQRGKEVGLNFCGGGARGIRTESGPQKCRLVSSLVRV